MDALKNNKVHINYHSFLELERFDAPIGRGHQNFVKKFGLMDLFKYSIFASRLSECDSISLRLTLKQTYLIQLIERLNHLSGRLRAKIYQMYLSNKK